MLDAEDSISDEFSEVSNDESFQVVDDDISLPKEEVSQLKARLAEVNSICHRLAFGWSPQVVIAARFKQHQTYSRFKTIKTSALIITRVYRGHLCRQFFARVRARQKLLGHFFRFAITTRPERCARLVRQQKENRRRIEYIRKCAAKSEERAVAEAKREAAREKEQTITTFATRAELCARLVRQEKEKRRLIGDNRGSEAAREEDQQAAITSKTKKVTFATRPERCAFLVRQQNEQGRRICDTCVRAADFEKERAVAEVKLVAAREKMKAVLEVKHAAALEIEKAVADVKFAAALEKEKAVAEAKRSATREKEKAI